MMSWWTWHQTSRKLWLMIFCGLLGVGALAKGPVAPALAVLVVGAYAALRRDGKIFLRTISVPGFALFFAIVLPWFVAIQVRVPQFFRVFFIEHNLERFGTNLYQHSQPFWYYIPVFLLAALPWTFFALPALVEAGRNAFRRESPEPAAPADDGLPGFLFLWIVVPIIFFSISRAKLPGYILPAIPAAALLTAEYIHRLKAVPRLLTSLHALLCAILLVGALIDRTQSARPINVSLAELGVSASETVATFNVKRQVAYGLDFYRNAPISHYEQEGPLDMPGRIPPERHVVVAKEGSLGAVQAVVGNRQVLSIGTFPLQHLEFFQVSAAK
jgi:4-amino-4-deoxy-L-arabinose transferase-like glycosyltransferase